jgi:hypothetical protein
MSWLSHEIIQHVILTSFKYRAADAGFHDSSKTALFFLGPAGQACPLTLSLAAE